MKISSVFKHGEKIPTENTCDGQNTCPELNIADVPKEAKSLVLIMDDPDAPAGTFVHWVAWNIHRDTKKIEKDSKAGVEGRGTSGRTGYHGPCPPPGHGPHRYFFRLYALDTELSLEEGAERMDLENAMEGHIIAEAELMGTYERR